VEPAVPPVPVPIGKPMELSHPESAVTQTIDKSGVSRNA
jgi:hypothetical protein